MNYNREYYCTYPFIFELLKNDGDEKEYTEEEKDMIQQISYKNDLLNIFFLSNANEEPEINECIQKQFYFVTHNSPEILNWCIELAKRYNSNYASLGFSLLFTYDYLHFTHTCISELMIGEISEITLQNLYHAIHPNH
jgi:hypothetical protein